MRKPLANTFLLLTLISFMPQQAKADAEAGAVQYQCIKELDEIVITYNDIRGDYSLFPSAKLPALALRGIYPVVGMKKKTFQRHEVIRGHQVDTTISIFPPAGGNGPGNEMHTAGLKIKVDKVTQVDCGLCCLYTSADRITLDFQDDCIYLSGYNYSMKPFSTAFILKKGKLNKAESGIAVIDEEAINAAYKREKGDD